MKTFLILLLASSAGPARARGLVRAVLKTDLALSNAAYAPPEDDDLRAALVGLEEGLADARRARETCGEALFSTEIRALAPDAYGRYDETYRALMDDFVTELTGLRASLEEALATPVASRDAATIRAARRRVQVLVESAHLTLKKLKRGD